MENLDYHHKCTCYMVKKKKRLVVYAMGNAFFFLLFFCTGNTNLSI